MILPLPKLPSALTLRRNLGKISVSVVRDWDLEKFDPTSVLHMLFERPATRFFPQGEKKKTARINKYEQRQQI